MPTYELACLLKVVPKKETVTILKRTAQAIFNQGGFIRKIENFGRKPTAYKISNHGNKYWEAQYFIYHFDAPPSSIATLCDEYERDIDIVNQRIFKKVVPTEVECTLHEETLPAPERENVKKMMADIKRKELKSSFRKRYYADLKDFPFQT